MKILPPQMTFEQALRGGHTGRIECRGYLDWLKTLPCDTCHAGPPSDPSHINAYKGIGTKSPDLFSIPECRACHEHYERKGKDHSDHQVHLQRCALYLLRAFWEGRLVWRKA